MFRDSFSGWYVVDASIVAFCWPCSYRGFFCLMYFLVILRRVRQRFPVVFGLIILYQFGMAPCCILIQVFASCVENGEIFQ